METTMAKAPDATWETDYRHDFRNHRHRCLACNRIINKGERVLMAKVADRTTRALHIDCADKVALPADMNRDGVDWTWRMLVEAQGNEHLRKLGWKIPEAKAA